MTTKEKEYWQGLSKGWFKRGRQRLWRRHHDPLIEALFAGWLGQRRVSRLLKTDLFEEANGQGLYALLTASSEQVVGIDIAPQVVRQARAGHPRLETREADVRRLPFPAEYFDVIISSSTLDHFRHREEIQDGLNELSRVLRPGGELMITLDNLVNPVVFFRNLLPFSWVNRLGLVPYYVGATCGPGRLRRYLNKAGLEVAEMTAVLHCPRVLAIALANLVERRCSGNGCQRFLAALSRFEVLSRWPTRYLSGYYVAAWAIKPRPQPPPA